MRPRWTGWECWSCNQRTYVYEAECTTDDDRLAHQLAPTDPTDVSQRSRSCTADWTARQPRYRTVWAQANTVIAVRDGRRHTVQSPSSQNSNCTLYAGTYDRCIQRHCSTTLTCRHAPVNTATAAVIYDRRKGNKKLITRWDSERELSLRHRTRTTKYNRLVHKFRHRSTWLRVGTHVYEIQWNNAI